MADLRDPWECEHFELWEYDKEGAYIGALPIKFPTAREAWRERKAMVREPRRRAYWPIIGFRDGRYFHLETGAEVLA